MLTNEIPNILRREIYALAALAGAAIVALGLWLQWPIVPVALVGLVVVAGLRILSLRYRWRSPMQQEDPGPA